MTYNYKMLFIAIIICMCMIMPVVALTNGSTTNTSSKIVAIKTPIPIETFVAPVETPVPDETIIPDETPVAPVETPVPDETPIVPYIPKYMSDDEPIDSGTGGLFIHVLCGNNIYSKEMTIQRTNITLPFYEDGIYYETNTPFINGNRIPKDYFDKIEKSGEPRTIELNLGGYFEDRYAPGVYAIMLKDGNGGQPEYALAALYHKYNTYISFIGHAVSSSSKTKEEPIPSGCPSVVSFDWIRGSNNLLFKFGVENTDVVNKWITLQYVVKYDRQIKCLEDNRLVFEKWQQPVQKCYEPMTITESLILPRYAPNGISSHMGIVDYTGVHKNEILQSVSIDSCFDAYIPKPQETTPS